jgi:arylsulfatase A-like enzyme
MLLGALVGAACTGETGADGTVLVPVHRFVPAPPDGSPLTSDTPRATIEDDTRFTLAAPTRRIIVWPKQLPDHEGPRVVKLRPVLPNELRDAEEIVVEVRVKVAQDWSTRPPLVVQPRRRGAFGTARFDLAVPAVPAGTPVVVTAEATAIDFAALADLRTEEVEIPVGALLEFALGIVEARYGPDPVEFGVRACEGERCATIFSEVFDPTRGDGAGWRERRVDLEHLAGRRRHFRFAARRLEEQGPFSFPVWGGPTLYAREPRGPGARSAILLSVDTLRADHLPSYGYGRETAPFVEERFGRGGVVFENPVAAATITTPSHASIFTALQPATHGATDGMKVIPENIPTLPERIRAAGIDTAAFTEDGWLSIRHGFGRGFDRFEENRSASIMSPDGQVDVTFGKAREWLERNRDKRFFLFLHTFQVHSPYAPPERYRELFHEDEGAGKGESPAEHLRDMANYDREIRYTDDELRGLFQTIDELGLGPDTIFVLTSDHGEAFLEHGLLEHGGRLHDEVVRVPLLLTGADLPRGRRIATPVAHVDLMPTILDLLGLPVPEVVEGSSLVPLLRGEPASDVELASRPLYSETRSKVAIAEGHRMIRFPVPAFMVRRGDRKLLRYPTPRGGHRYELYDLAADPGERRDLFESHPDDARDLVLLLEGYEERSRALRARIDAGARAEDTQPEVILDPAQEEKLRALGYLD